MYDLETVNGKEYTTSSGETFLVKCQNGVANNAGKIILWRKKKKISCGGFLIFVGHTTYT